MENSKSRIDPKWISSRGRDASCSVVSLLSLAFNLAVHILPGLLTKHTNLDTYHQKKTRIWNWHRPSTATIRSGSLLDRGRHVLSYPSPHLSLHSHLELQTHNGNTISMPVYPWCNLCCRQTGTSQLVGPWSQTETCKLTEEWFFCYSRRMTSWTVDQNNCLPPFYQTYVTTFARDVSPLDELEQVEIPTDICQGLHTSSM